MKERNLDKFKSLVEKNIIIVAIIRVRLQSGIEIKSILKNFFFLKSIFVNLKLLSNNNELILNFYFERYINYFIWNNFCENYNLQNYICYLIINFNIILEFYFE